MTVFIGWPGPVFPEDEQEQSFKNIQDCMDRDTWIGRGCTEQLPGGGNTLGKGKEKHE
jgi:hypothetical protein